ncbi:MAG TPA: NAD-dependent epimerase/dehydratase family protein [Kofleriaceae bacterium]|jgi:nucleoside-diphosphate-sugar epimerase
MTRAWLILGAGYTGTQLARTLRSRPDLAASVTVTRRDREVARALGAALGVRGERADLSDPASLDVPAGAVVVCTAPPGGDPAGEIRALIEAAREAARIVYVSSTGVYGPGHGAWVDERWPIAPITASGRARAAAEAALDGAIVPWLALRAAGIYGPGRGLVDRIRAGTYRVVGDGTSHVGRIHVVDLVAAIVAAGAPGGSAVTGAVNVADDDPAPIGEVADAVAARLGLPPPPRVPVAEVSPEVAGMLTANRRIANRRMRDELGVALRYPSWRDGLAAELASPA